MLQRKIISLSILGLLSSASVQAQVYSSPNDVLKQAESLLSPRVACLEGDFSEPEPVKPNPYGQCIKDICGEDPATVFSANERYIEKSKAQTDKAFDELLQEGLDDVFDTVLGNAKKAMRELSPEERQEVIAQMQVDTLYSEYLQSLMEAIIEAFSVSDAPIEALPYFESEAIASMNSIYPPELVQAFERKRTLTMIATAEANSSLANLNKDQLLTIIKRERIADGAWRLPDTLGAERMRIMSAMAQTSNQIPIDSRGGHMSGNEDILLLQNYLSLQAATLLSRSENEIKEINAGILKDYESSMGDLPDPLKSLEARLEETKTACSASLKSNLASLPTEDDIAATRVKIDQTKAQIISEVKSKGLFSLQSSRELAKHLNGVEVRLPASKQDYARSLGALFGNLKGFSNVVGKKDKVYGAIAMTRGADCFSEAKYDTNMAYYFEQAHDHDHGFVYLDSSTIHDFGAVGRPVLSHELGHAVSIYFLTGKGSFESRQMRKDVMRCLRRGHVSGGFFQKLFASSPTVFSEEDFADSFAAQVMPQASNLGCSLTKEGAPSSRDLGVLTSVQLNYQSVGNPSWQHSSTVYRMLHWEANTKKALPNSCKRVMEEFGENVNFPKHCWSQEIRKRQER